MMAVIDFYEKPGCVNNTRQKRWLIASGHQVVEHNLLTEALRPKELRAFFGNLPVAKWFNRSAPTIKSGQVVPERLDESQAIALMIHDPLLIRRPLMQVGDKKSAGFDSELLAQWIGLNETDGSKGNIETCPKLKAGGCVPKRH